MPSRGCCFRYHLILFLFMFHCRVRSSRKDVKAEDRLKERSAIALLCGSILRAFSWGWGVIPTGAMRTNKPNLRIAPYTV